MPERSTKGQRVQFGFEAAYDGGATVNRRWLGLTLDLDMQASRNKNMAQGYNFASSTTLGKDYTEGSLGGTLVFDELQDVLTMALGAVTPTAMTPATAQAWVWNLPNSGDITPKSVKVEKGDTNTAESVTGVVVTDLSFSWDRDSVSIDGSVMGTKLNESATLTNTA
jgi:hypothetical protein